MPVCVRSGELILCVYSDYSFHLRIDGVKFSESNVSRHSSNDILNHQIELDCITLLFAANNGVSAYICDIKTVNSVVSEMWVEMWVPLDVNESFRISRSRIALFRSASLH
jgi:hypothetical protein